MIIIFLKENWELITGLIGSVVAFFTGRKSKRQNEKTTELENLEKVREIEKKLIDDMENQIDKLIKYNDYLEEKLVKYIDKYGVLT